MANSHSLSLASGTSDYVDFGDVHDFDYNQAFSVECQVKTSTSGNNWLVTKMDSASPFSGWALFLRDIGSGDLRIAFILGSTSAGLTIDKYGATDLNDGAWHHCLCAWNSTTIQYYQDDVEDLSSGESTQPGGADIEYNGSTHSRIGSRMNTSPGNWLNGDLSELYFTNEYLDISVQSNRRKFITSGLEPADLGTDGSDPTGTAPLIYFSGVASTWNAGTNAGSGGDFTMTGAVTDSANEPVDAT